MFSGSILSTIEEAESDFLLLFDCCNAYHPPNRPSGAGRNVIEVISAVGFGAAVAAEPGTDSFTHHLDEALALAKSRGPLKVVDLYMHIINRLFPEAPSRLRSGSSFVVDRNGAPVEQKSRRQCPVHYWLSGRPKSITLAPLRKKHAGESDEFEAVVKLSHKSPVSTSVDTPQDLAETGVVQFARAEFPQVLISFRVTKDLFDVETWVKWLLEAPPEARDLIKIQGFYGSFSSLLLVKMPVQIWSLLPESSAVSFIGFTTTENLGPDLQKQVDGALTDVSRLQNRSRPTESDRQDTDLDMARAVSKAIPAASCGSSAMQSSYPSARLPSEKITTDPDIGVTPLIEKRESELREVDAAKLQRTSPSGEVLERQLDIWLAGHSATPSKKQLQMAKSRDVQDHGPAKEPGRRRNKITPSGSKEAPLRFACPFFKNSPDLYQNVKTCGGPGWNDVHRVM
ncbi:hypothetical protein MFIFM68171_04863 [Madurella fahalii]|uniref:Uncharacterized protein n=1 Tax=Madurella fahalii TaxID=1157608 RepID=A0ABQ0GA55_9PEZI